MPAAKANTYRTSSRISQLKATPRSRWIEVQLNEQQILVWEGNQIVYSSVMSSGTADRPTREGTFEIQSMHISARMRGSDYDVPDVPYTMYYSGNYALHGAYWHSNFGTPVSHGCINLPIVAADWIFSWAHVGTPVIVH
ncbi:MAG: L,D-transpeptidase [Cyanobacteria bacterium P01_D01_bin.36]